MLLKVPNKKFNKYPSVGVEGRGGYTIQ